MRSIARASAVGLIALVAAACSSGAASSPSTAASAAASEAAAATATADPCATGSLKTLTAGTLTIGTDNPAYPPYFAQHASPYPSPWEDLGYTGDPTSGEGFESAVAYAIAQQLGFSKDKVAWTVVKFDTSYAPGPKAFDFDINQVSYTPERAQSVDMSDGYYDLNQAVVALKTNAASKATSIADLAKFKLGAQLGTTSYQTIQNVIKPTTEGAVFDTNDLAIAALKAGTIDALVVDLPTADFVTNVQIENSAAAIVGQLKPAGGTNEHFSLVLAKGSPLTACVNQAIAALKSAGTLSQLASKWLPFQDAVPVLK